MRNLLLLLGITLLTLTSCSKNECEILETGSLNVSLNLDEIALSNKGGSASKSATSTFEHQYDGHELVIRYTDGQEIVLEGKHEYVSTNFNGVYNNLRLGEAVVFIRPKTPQDQLAYLALGYTTPEVPVTINLLGTSVTLTQEINMGLVTFDLSQLDGNVISDDLILQETAEGFKFRNNYYLYFADGHTPTVKFFDASTGLNQDVELSQVSAKVHNHYIITSDNNVGVVVDDTFTQTTETLKK